MHHTKLVPGPELSAAKDGPGFKARETHSTVVAAAAGAEDLEPKVAGVRSRANLIRPCPFSISTSLKKIPSCRTDLRTSLQSNMGKTVFEHHAYRTYLCIVIVAIDRPRAKNMHHLPGNSLLLNYFCSLTMTYGISTSSSVWSSAVISKMTFFWCSGIGFLLINSTSLLILYHVSNVHGQIAERKTHVRPILSFNLAGG
jgi:hypothetical protein